MDGQKPVDWRNVAYYARGAFAVIIALAVLVGGGYFAYSKITEVYTDLTTPEDDYVGDGTGEVEVVIPQGAGITQIGDILYEAGVVKSVRKFRSEAQRSGQAGELQAGRFRLQKELPAETAFAMLLDPANIQRIWITFPEGLTSAEQAQRIHNELEVPMEEIEAAYANTEALTLPEWAEGDVEGLLFPSRYVVAEPITALGIVQRQLSQFNTVASRVDLAGRAEALEIEPRDILTIASIIEGEVSNPDYQPLVAAVIYNRIEQDMKLEMDSTVHFFAGNEGGGVTTTAEQRATDHPYNTYFHEGLPPGPITNPGESAMNAALSPADSDAIFFVTIDLDTGETVFADTYEEHEQNVATWQQWCGENPGRC
ncbi:MAG: endolytic transglycosylase MltG [Propionibacterium sp.]|nr:endolytic transglycosylase MltG [Propionibacterium sp.]